MAVREPPQEVAEAAHTASGQKGSGHAVEAVPFGHGLAALGVVEAIQDQVWAMTLWCVLLALPAACVVC